jgi:4-methyl-5(b-hydroxyethyl)-thiazole monophosphate biosynthesis
MKRVFIHLANGFEEVEAITPVDVLRRAGCEVTLVSVTGKREVTSARGLAVQSDRLFEDMDYSQADVILFPGGQPGSDNLTKHEGLKKLIPEFHRQGKMIAAICAAPMVLANAEILEGKRVTCFPGTESRLKGAICTGNAVEIDGNIITGKAAGAAMTFSLALTELLVGKSKADELKKIMYVE